ncbi:hypothetical protein K502DRAFT_337354 [Neoconidiobolus thromboides FSU 785]|nr:hypothetical protein K502DRAFT_337354 [Neoconidiobolus thromboides FSU 785]
MALETKTLGIISFYWITSLSLVFLNKFIFNGKYLFPYILFVTWFQLIISLALICLVLRNRSIKFEFQWNILKKILPLSLIYLGMLLFNNLCLNYVEVTFYQVARSLTIIFNLLFSFLFLNEKINSKIIYSCIFVFAGFVLGSVSEIKFSWIGLIAGILSSIFVSTYSIMVKKVLVVVQGDEWLLLFYNTLISITLLLPTIFISGEYNQILQFEYIHNTNFWLIMSVTAIFGFLINYAIFLQIKFTSPLSNCISGTAKAAVQTLLAAYIFKNPINLVNGVGISIVIIGSGCYSLIRYYEKQNNSKNLKDKTK